MLCNHFSFKIIYDGIFCDSINDYMELILDGEVILKTDKLNINNELHINNITKYDFAIYSKYDNTKSITNKQIITNLNDIKDEEEINLTESLINFLLCEIKITDVNLKLDFKTKNYNYYINNNIFDINFFIYFIKKYHKINLSRIDNYKLNIIDNNCSELKLDNTKIIKFYQNKYEIFNTNDVKKK
jgi:hypothetical protein